MMMPRIWATPPSWLSGTKRYGGPVAVTRVAYVGIQIWDLIQSEHSKGRRALLSSRQLIMRAGRWWGYDGQAKRFFDCNRPLHICRADLDLSKTVYFFSNGKVQLDTRSIFSFYVIWSIWLISMNLFAKFDLSIRQKMDKFTSKIEFEKNRFQNSRDWSPPLKKTGKETTRT